MLIEHLNIPDSSLDCIMFSLINCLTAQSRLLTALGKKPFESLLETSIFSYTHNVYYPSNTKFQLLCLIYFVACKGFQIGLVKNIVWYRVKNVEAYVK